MTLNFLAVRVAVSLIAILAWLAASNHCAIGATDPSHVANAPAHAHCPGHHSSHEGDRGDEMECCKSFPPASVDAGKNLVSYDSNFFVLQLYLVSALLAPESSASDLRPLELDTGPPFSFSFVESVLQRSLLAHAPPSLA